MRALSKKIIFLYHRNYWYVISCQRKWRKTLFSPPIYLFWVQYRLSNASLISFDMCLSAHVPNIIWQAGGHSTTTWTKFHPILTTYPPWVDNYGHFTYYQIFVHVTKRGLSKDHLPTSFCPRSYWMPPSAANIQFLFWQHYHHIILTSTTTCLWRVQFRQNRIFFLLCEQKKKKKKKKRAQLRSPKFLDNGRF